MKKIKKNIFRILIFFVPFFVFANTSISYYEFFKEVQKPEGELQGDFYIKIDSDIYSYTNNFLSDIKVFNEDEKEIPYKISSKKGYSKKISKDKSINFQKIDEKTYLLDFGVVPVGHWFLYIKTDSKNFRRVVDIYGSDLKNTRFKKLNITDRGERIYSAPEGENKNIWYKHTKNRYLKIVFNGDGGKFNVKNFILKNTEQKFIEGETEKVKTEIKKNLNTQQAELTKDSFIIDTKKNSFPISYFIFKTNLENYNRKIKIYSSDNENSIILDRKNQYNKNTPFWKKVYSGNLYKQIYTEDLKIEVNDNKRYYLVVIENGDNEKLKILEAEAYSYIKKIYLSKLDFNKHKYFIYFGGGYNVNSNYDLTGFSSDNPRILKLSKVEKNNLYKEKEESIFSKEPYIFYLLIISIMIILSWFVYKIAKEVQHKDKDEDDIINKIKK